MRSNLMKITESELEVMKVLWSFDKPINFTTLRQAFSETDWDVSTVKTLLRRLCKKEAVKAVKKEVYYYEALISKKEYQEGSTKALIDKLYLGSAKNLVASLLDSSKLSEDDIKELRDMFVVGDDDE